MDPMGQPLGHPYGAPVPQGLYPAGLVQQFPQSVPYGLPPPAFQLPYHHAPPSYPMVGPPPSAAAPMQAAAVPQPAPVGPWEAAPRPVPPPLDHELERRIEKLVEYVAKNGPQFENMMKEKQVGNPAYAFLFGAEGYSYYKYRLWLHVNGLVAPSTNATPSALHPSTPAYSALPLHGGMRPPSLSVPAMNPHVPLPALGQVPMPVGSYPVGSENIHAQSQPLLLHQQQPSSLLNIGQPDVGHVLSKDENEPFKGLGGPLPPDVAAELDEVLKGLTGTKDSIKGAKTWFMQRSIFSPALAEALREYVLAAADAERQLHVIYLVNDILFSSLQKRENLKELDNEAHAFKPFLGAMLGAIYHNAANAEANRERLVKILGFWGDKEVYDADTIKLLEGEMIAGPPRKSSSSNQSLPFHPGLGSIQSPALVPSNHSEVPFSGHWESDVPHGVEPKKTDQHQESYSRFSSDQSYSMPYSQFSMPVNHLSTAASGMPALYSSLSSTLLSPLPASNSTTQSVQQLTSTATLGKSPYPHFPPGLIPGIVRKVQVGSGVPYSPVSPLDIPTSIPPSTAPESYILDRVAKFFRDIGETDPLQGQQGGSYEGDTKDEAEESGRKGGARIPPPKFNSEPVVDLDGRSRGIGGSADVDESRWSDDVYSSHSRQSNSSYHTLFSARATAR